MVVAFSKADAVYRIRDGYENLSRTPNSSMRAFSYSKGFRSIFSGKQSRAHANSALSKGVLHDAFEAIKQSQYGLQVIP